MLTITNQSTGEILQISHENKKGIDYAREILTKWLFNFDNITIRNTSKQVSQFD